MALREGGVHASHVGRLRFDPQYLMTTLPFSIQLVWPKTNMEFDSVLKKNSAFVFNFFSGAKILGATLKNLLMVQ